MEKSALMFIVFLACSFFGSPVQAHQPDMFILPVEDEVYVYHDKALPLGHGFNLYRQDVRGGEYALLNDEPIRGVRRADELQSALDVQYERVLGFFDETSPGGLFLSIRSNPIEANLATYLFPEFARAMGRLFIDETAPRKREVSYRMEFVNAAGDPTGEEFAATVFIETTRPKVPEITDVKNQGRRVTMHWYYPISPDDDPDYVTQFYIYRLHEHTNEPQLLTGDMVVVRNNAVDEHFISFQSPVINTTERYVMTAVNISGREGDPSPVYEYELLDNIPPGPVLGLTSRVNQVRDNQFVSLTWDMNREADLAGYYVYRGTDMAEDFERLTPEAIDPSDPGFVDTDLNGGMAYFYYVTAVDRQGNESAMSDMVMAQVHDLATPPTPENFTAEFNLQTLGVDLSWEMPEFPPNFESFIIMRRREDTHSPGAFARINLEHLRDVSYSDISIAEIGHPEGALYRYVLFSSSRAKNYSDSISVLIEIPLLTPPEPPVSLAAINENGHRVSVSWGASPSYTTEKYHVYRKAIDDESFALLEQVPVSRRLVRDEDVELATEYVYAVSAVDRADNESELSEPDTLLFRNFTPPRSVRNVQAAVTETGVELRWERVATNDLAGYRVYRASIPTGRYEAIHDGLLTETSYLDREGTQDHWYRVRAIDTSGNESRPGDPVRPINRNN